MQLTLTGSLAKQLADRTKGDRQLAMTLAAELLAQRDPMSVARYLLDRNTALALIADRLQNAPQQTLRELGDLPARTPGHTRQKRTRGAAKPAAKPARAAGAGHRAAKAGGRLRLSSAQIEALKVAVRGFLARHGWATRKQISEAARLPTPSIYNRVMNELQGTGEVKARGEKAKRVYGLKGGAKAPAKEKRAKATPKPKPAAQSKRPVRCCPVPGCTGTPAPVFGMVCKAHKDLSKAERDKLFAARRKVQR